MLSGFICEYLESNGIIVSTDIENAPSETRLDVIIVDDANLTREFISKAPDTKILLFDTGLNADELVTFFNSFNIHGIISPNTDKRKLIEAINPVYKGVIWIDNDSLKDLFQKERQDMVLRNLIQHLTEREKQITECFLEGLSNKEIANRLSIS